MHRYSHNTSSRRRMLALGLAALTTAAVLVAMLTNHGSRPRRTTAADDVGTNHARPTASAPPASGIATPAPATNVPRLPATDDPVQYAKEVASKLFGVDPARTTRTSFVAFWRGQLPTVVYSDGASKGLTLQTQDADALANLTTWWVPSQSAWASEARDRTSNTLLITSVTVPDYWANAVAAGKFRDPGLHVERVMGVLTQAYGTDAQHRYSTRRPVVIDVALLCGPTQVGGCRLVAPQQPPGNGAT